MAVGLRDREEEEEEEEGRSGDELESVSMDGESVSLEVPSTDRPDYLVGRTEPQQ